MNDLELAWLAGLLEGEGCFSYGRKDNCPRIALGMTDADVVKHVAILMGGRFWGPYRKDYPHSKLLYCTAISGYKAARLMSILLTFLSERRVASIKLALAQWNSKPRGREKGLPAECHPGRTHYAHGLCIQCYQAKRMHHFREKIRTIEALL